MTQDFNEIPPNQSGSTYRSLDNARVSTLLSNSKGSDPPTYAVSGTVWLDDAADPIHIVRIYDGNDWIEQGRFNSTTNQWIPANVQTINGSTNYVETTGSSNAYEATLSPAPAFLSVGFPLRMNPNHTNIGNATLNLNGLGAVSIRKNGSEQLQAGDLIANQICTLVYDGTNFQFIPSLNIKRFAGDPNGNVAAGFIGQLCYNTTAERMMVATTAGNAATAVWSSDPLVPPIPLNLPVGYRSGFKLSNNTTDANNDMDIAAGKCRSDDDTTDIILPSAITKQLDAAWAAGNNQGCLDTGSKANNTWYYRWVISKDNGLDPDILFSTSRSSPTMPPGYTKKRLLNGAVRTDGSANNRGIVQVGNLFLFKTQIEDILLAGIPTSGTLGVVTCPPDTMAMINLTARSISTRGSVIVSSPYADDQAPGADDTTGSGIKTLAWRANAVYVSTEFEVLVNTSSQVRYRREGADVNLSFVTKGWMELE